MNVTAPPVNHSGIYGTDNLTSLRCLEPKYGVLAFLSSIKQTYVYAHLRFPDDGNLYIESSFLPRQIGTWIEISEWNKIVAAINLPREIEILKEQLVYMDKALADSSARESALKDLVSELNKKSSNARESQENLDKLEKKRRAGDAVNSNSLSDSTKALILSAVANSRESRICYFQPSFGETFERLFVWKSDDDI